MRLYTVANGLSSDQIRSLEGTDGTLWIGTFGGGLDALRDGRFSRNGKRRAAERQRFAHRRRRQGVAVAEHHARHLPYPQTRHLGFGEWQDPETSSP